MADPTILHVVGARPNFMKIAPLLREMEARGRSRNVLVHTGQHYDREMSDDFFRDLGIRRPDHDLGVGSASHGRQTAAVLERMEALLEEIEPDLVVVVGDVNSTLAASLAAVKMQIPVAHVEAGLRSGDLGMPEEINRILTDRISLFLLTPSADGDENLRREGLPDDRIHRVGNIMIDTLMRHMEAMEADEAPDAGADAGAVASEGDAAPYAGGTASVLAQHGVEPGKYAVATLHRPSNVDDRDALAEIASAFADIADGMPLLLPLHPRTRQRAEEYGVDFGATRLLDPVGYLTMLALQKEAAVVLTDSGGLQEETTVLGVPCLTLRPSTERPITVTEGTNRLVQDRSRASIVEAFRETLADPPAPRRPELWDGRASERIADVFEAWWAEGAPGLAESGGRMVPAVP